MLHTVNKSPFEKNSLHSCLRLSKPGANILLLEDGVYSALKGSDISEDIEASLADRGVYVLGPDLKARGIHDDRLIDGVQVVDYAGFVKLAVDAPRVQSWL